jgi:SAM-dependent methyltransferase
MMSDYRQDLFRDYERHTSVLDSSDDEKLAWFRGYVQVNYQPTIQRFASWSDPILEIGCNKGYLLAALTELGFSELTGIDLSPIDLERARSTAPAAHLERADAMEFLPERQATYSVIVMKAVLEHVRKDEVLEFLRRTAAALRPGGALIVDVPNMDWLFAAHERYMDFTHEGGFTSESLQQTLGSVFKSVTVTPVDNALPYARLADSQHGNGLRTRVRTFRRAAARGLLTSLLKWADPEGASLPIWKRSLVAVAEK